MIIFNKQLIQSLHNMEQIKIIPLEKPINTSVTIPGCLSYTIRALNLAAMTNGSVKIQNALKSDDTYAMFNVLKTLGIKVEEGLDYFIVHGTVDDVKDDEYTLDINISGRTARTVLGLLCIVPGTKTLTCKESFKKRPIADLVDGLKQLGAEIEYMEKDGYLPVKITSSTLKPGTAKMKGSVSSQYFSSIMMIAPKVGKITIEVIGEQASKPFIDVTISAMKEFGVDVINEDYKRYRIRGNQEYKNETYIVEADAISASYFWGIAAITKSSIKVLNLPPSTAQGDVRFADILEKMGCELTKNESEKWIEIRGTDNLRRINIDMNANPDTVQTLAVVAAFAKRTTHITGIHHLKIKETDRIEAPRKELEKMGVDVKTTDDSMTIVGGNPHGADIDTYGDHRMAMAFAVAGTKTPSIIINNPKVVSKSFPTFWDVLQSIGIHYEK